MRAEKVGRKRKRTQPLKATRSACGQLDGRLLEMTARLEEANRLLSSEIEERDRVRHDLEKSEERYCGLIQSVTDYVYTVRVEDGVSASSCHGPGCIAVTGYSSEDFDTDPLLWYRMIYEPDRDRVMDQIRRLLGGERVQPLEHRIVHKDGSIRWIRNIPVQHFDGNGVLTSYDGLVRNITESIRLEEQLRQAQKMEAVGHLAGGIAHDFNNILTAIMGYGNLLQVQMNENDHLKGYVDQILVSAERASALTQSLLAFSRKQVMNPRPVSLNTIVCSIEKLLRRLIGEDIDFKASLSELDITVMADSLQIEQVLMNLCTNARDAMPGGGTLSIETGVVSAGADYAAAGLEKPGSYAVLSVTDTGVGMDDETREHVFEPFFTTKEAGKGTGLGLAIVYGIVNQHHGTTHVYSEPGIGTTFRLYLPLAEACTTAEAKADGAFSQGGGETILLAEDDPDARKLLRSVLELAGYRVIEASDGEEALTLFQQNRELIRLVLSDVVMPKKNGCDVCEELALADPGIRFILMSGYAYDTLSRKGIREKNYPLLQKPILPNDLLRAVREMLDR